ncbi:MAG: tRNA-specific 2-thiouridylase [Alistipes sp.]|nr:tRNA-specific 2-thiouridylase [Alistipes sp.]
MERSVILGFSGGIDSTSAVDVLREQGYRVIALTIDTMGDSTMLEKAEQRAKELSVEWHAVDAKAMFERDIIEYFCNEYTSGRTPAPCTRCNTHIKWQILLTEANRLGVEYIATGHYFNIEQHNDKYYVAKALDSNKDQSYYLWGLPQEILSRAIAPMGSKIKSEVKEGFKDKSESMGICFLCRRPYAEFLESRGIEMQSGDIVDEMGRVCGRHNGIARYTIGQKRGEGIPEGKRVIDIEPHANIIRVGDNSMLYKSKLYITDCNIVDECELLTAKNITIKIRGIGKNPELPIGIERYKEGYMITTTDKAYAPALGQPLVLYRDNLVIGGGIVDSFE